MAPHDRNPPVPGPAPDARPLSEDAITRLLGLARVDTSETVQSLCCRLSAPDGEAWLQSVLAATAGLTTPATGTPATASPATATPATGPPATASPATATPDTATPYAAMPPDEPRLVALKDLGKTHFAEAQDHEARLAGLLIYLVAITLGHEQLGRSISSRPTEELSRSLLAVAESLPPTWSERFARAALAMAEGV